MTVEAILAWAGAASSAVVAAVVWWRGKPTFANRSLAGGLFVLSAGSVLAGLAAQADTASGLLLWLRLRLVAMSLAPGVWLLFSLSFARVNYPVFLRNWRWVAVSVFAVPLALVGLGGTGVLAGAEIDPAGSWFVPLGIAGFGLQVVLLLCAVLVLINLESTLRASTGSMRWQIKFLLLGVGAVFAAQIYESSQALLYSAVDPRVLVVSSTALVGANLLIAFSLVRTRLAEVDVYLSEPLLYNSLTVLIVGVYLLAVSALAKIASALGGPEGLAVATFVVLVAFIALAAVLLSGELRERTKRLMRRHLKRPAYDYRNVWTRFTEKTSVGFDAPSRSAALAKTVSEIFGAPIVTLWLWDEAGERLVLGGSTGLGREQARELLASSEGGRPLERVARADSQSYLDVLHAADLSPGQQDFLRRARIRYVVPMVVGEKRVGLITLNERLTREPLGPEDVELLTTLADQAAVNLLNLELSERLLQAKEMEAFQSLSAFFVHDLKNLASRLSLTLQNLPDHYEDPSFRKDLLRVISQSVDKIQDMCARLSPLSRELELHRRETSLNDLVAKTLQGMNGAIRSRVVEDLRPVPPIPLDTEQIQKVLLNLILNANDATAGNGEIRVSTQEREGWAVLSVRDDGCGMSMEFVERCLFKPFQTTKKQGLGIGLYHSKKIVEAHEGRIEVESAEGKGSVFHIMLPERGPRPT